MNWEFVLLWPRDQLRSRYPHSHTSSAARVVGPRSAAHSNSQQRTRGDKRGQFAQERLERSAQNATASLRAFRQSPFSRQRPGWEQPQQLQQHRHTLGIVSLLAACSSGLDHFSDTLQSIPKLSSIYPHTTSSLHPLLHHCPSRSCRLPPLIAKTYCSSRTPPHCSPTWIP